MKTQKQNLANLKADAATLGALVTIRKNLYGEYETRIRMNGSRDYVLNYLAHSFMDAYATAKFNLNRIENDQREEGLRREREYQRELQSTLHNFAPLFSSLGCTLMMTGHIVRMISPVTGEHSLNMTLGVRPVSDLVAHATGFLEQQMAKRSTPRYYTLDERGTLVSA